MLENLTKMNFLYINFVIVLWLTAITTFLLGIFVLVKNLRNIVNKTFAFYSFSISWWSFSEIWGIVCDKKSTALTWTRIEQVGVFFIPTLFIHFVISLLNIKNKKWLLRFAYCCSIVFAILCYTPLMIADSVPNPVPYVKYFGSPGLAYHFAILFFVVLTIYGLSKLYSTYRLSYGARRNQLKYLFWSSLIGYTGGAANFFLVYDISIPTWNPFGTYALPMYIAVVAYAITRHQLMDIEVIIKKSLVFAGMFIFAFGVFVGITLLVSQIFGAGRIISLAISALLITIGLRPIEAWLVNATDKFLFQKKYEYKQILKAFIDEVITVLNLDEIVTSTLKLLDQALHPYAAAIFILNKAEDKFQLYNSYGLENKNIIFTSESRLITFFKNSGTPAIIKQVNGISGVNSEIQQEMLQLKAVLCLPLIIHKDIIGFISLGRKKSDEEYSKDDSDVLLDLARTESIAVGNAQLLQEAAQAERRAAIGTMSAGINHEIGNPLNIMSTKIQVFKLSRQKGLFKDKPNEEILDQAEGALDECLKQSGRISEITKKLSNFAKPSKEFKPQLVGILEEIDETLSMVGHDLELEKISIEKNISSGLNKILADKREIQQIFFNIIRNAAQAIEETGKITISAVNTTNSKVHIEIHDTGKGIPDDKAHRIFEPFFTTKGPNKGTGLGLSIVRQLVWKNKGEISFKSQVGAGTTFILEFPEADV